MATDFLRNGPEGTRATILLAHGAGAPMDSASMSAAAEALAAENLSVVRFEFAYMARRRTEGGRRPPPWAAKLKPEYIDAVADLNAAGPLIIGGKSMGGRVASMVADALFADKKIAGLLCLGYPFHPPAKPDQLRTKHLQTLQTPTLICQGTRDSLGGAGEVPGYDLAPGIEVIWLEDGDHDLKPRRTVSGFSAAEHLATMAGHVAAWIHRIT